MYSGWMKAFQYEQAQAAWPWVGDVPKPFVFMIGILELAGVLGLILPLAAGIAPILTPIAALGLAVTVLLGAAFHVSRKEYKEIRVNIVFHSVIFISPLLLILALFRLQPWIYNIE